MAGWKEAAGGAFYDAGGATVNRYRDWLEQDRINLAHAERSVDMGDHAWACFAALRALHLRRGQVAWGHSIIDLLDTLPAEAKPTDTLLEKSRVLDRHYIPTRYPDVHPAGPAARHYTA